MEKGSNLLTITENKLKIQSNLYSNIKHKMVDKMFLMLPEFRMVPIYDHKKASQDFFQENPDLWETTKKAQREGFLASYKELLETNPELAEEIDVDDNRFLQWYIKNSNVRKTEWDENVAKAYHTWFKKNKSKYIIKQKPAKRNYSGLPQDNKVEERNNMLIDISYAILTHKDVALNVLSPGNYDNLKLAARVASLVENKGLLQVFKREYNIQSNTELAQKLLNITLKEIDDFMSDHRIEKSLLSPSTFVYYHTQNMAGSKLIGMYANNTTAQAKFQTSDIQLKDYMVFRINGIDIKLLNSITSEANELISKNCAECSAASVDNAKDPVLADLMQNPKTANILGTMLRAGMTIQEAGLLFTVPSIRAIIREKGKLDKDSIKKMLPENIKISELLQEVDKTDFTSLDIMKSILDPGEDADKLILGLMYKIVGIADVMGELTRNSRADSPNGALQNSVVGAILQTERVSRLRRATSEKNFPLFGIGNSWIRTGELFATPSTPKDILREKLKSSKMSRLQAFYTLGIDLPTQLLSDVFMHFNPDVRRITNYIFNNMEDMPYESTMEEAYRGITLYQLSKTRLFGDDGKLSAEEKRKYYTTKYARKFKRLLEQNPDVASIGVMQKLEVSNSKITMQRSARLTPTQREMFMSDFDSLLYHDNPIAQEMVKDLMMYSYYAENLNFGPNSFGNFFSPTFYNAFPELVEAIRLMGEGQMSDSERINIIEQLYSNIPNLATKPERVEVAGNDGKDLKVVAKSVHNTSLGGTNTWDYIRIDDDVYKKSQENAEYVMYTPVPKLNNLYNANKSVDEINKLQDSLGITSNYSRQSTYSYDDVLDEIDAVIKKKDLTTEGNSGQTEAKYSSEQGNKVLENKGMKPLC